MAYETPPARTLMSSQVKSRSVIKRLPVAEPLVGFWGLVAGGEMERKRDVRWNESSSPATTATCRTSAGGQIWHCRCYLTLLELRPPTRRSSASTRYGRLRAAQPREVDQLRRGGRMGRRSLWWPTSAVPSPAFHTLSYRADVEPEAKRRARRRRTLR